MKCNGAELAGQYFCHISVCVVCSDYGFERSHMEGNRCFADFWHDPDSPPEDCHRGQTYESSTGSVHAHKRTRHLTENVARTMLN